MFPTIHIFLALFPKEILGSGFTGCSDDGRTGRKIIVVAPV